jgi:hypothetical protein
MATIESVKKQLAYSKKQTSYAWSQYYELQRQEYEEAYNQVQEYEDNELDDEIPIGLNPHLMKMIQDLYAKSKEKIECPICLERIESDDLKTGKCGHNFHQCCIDIWLEASKKKCPLCKTKF